MNFAHDTDMSSRQVWRIWKLYCHQPRSPPHESPGGSSSGEMLSEVLIDEKKQEESNFNGKTTQNKRLVVDRTVSRVPTWHSWHRRWYFHRICPMVKPENERRSQKSHTCLKRRWICLTSGLCECLRQGNFWSAAVKTSLFGEILVSLKNDTHCIPG